MSRDNVRFVNEERRKLIKSAVLMHTRKQKLYNMLDLFWFQIQLTELNVDFVNLSQMMPSHFTYIWLIVC